MEKERMMLKMMTMRMRVTMMMRMARLPEQPEEDPSGSVNQTHQQITMCVRDQKASRTERHCSESHRVDEIKFVREISIDRGKRS